jgi:endoglucanase
MTARLRHAYHPLVVLLLLAATVAFALLRANTPAHAAAGTAFLRVNQVGYVDSSAKRAYLIASVSEAGATFAVRNSANTTVYSAPIGADLGRWSNTYQHVYPVDFTSLSTVGTGYTIVITPPTGAPGATSPAFRIDNGTALYSTAIANSLNYYQVQRDGADYVPSTLRTAAAHLHDTTAQAYLTPSVNSSGRFSGDLTPISGVTIDASGGWFDAGDYLKFLHGAAYTAQMLMVGVRDFPNQMGSGAGSRNFTAEARHGADWLLRMWDDPSRTLYYQVGIGTGNAKTLGDHDIWRLPQADDTFGGTDPVYRYVRNRPVFRVNTPGAVISPNLAGREAGALALCYQLFRVSDPTFANRCLVSAQHVYDLANLNPSGNLVTVIPYSFYPETEWRDDLELAAVELHKALVAAAGSPPAGLPHTDPAFYLQQAAHWANAYITGPGDAADTLNLYDVAGLAHYELHRAITAAGSPPGLETSTTALVADLRKQLDRATAAAASDPFGFGFPWATWDTTSHGAGLAVTASEYAALTGDSTYKQWANRWIGNILGANAWGLSLIIGTGTTFPDCPHHQIANLVGSLDGTSPVLAGAAVEGTNSITGRGSVSGMRACPVGGADTYAAFSGQGAVFKDNVESYPNTEPAIDLTAASPLAFAWQSLGG